MIQCGMIGSQHKSAKPLSENSGFHDRTFDQSEIRAPAAP